MYPILLEFGPITIYTLWFFIALGFVIGSVLFARLAHKNRLNLDVITTHSFTILCWSIVGARILFIFTHLPLFFYNFQFSFQNIFTFFAIWDKGLSLWGGLIGFLYALWKLSKQYQLPLLKWLDITALSVSSAFIFGNIGAFFDGINFGNETILPWGMIFENAIVKYAVPIHPTQLYALIYSSAITAFLFSLYLRQKNQLRGLIFQYMVFLYAVCRFFEEFFRGDDVLTIIGIRTPQLIAFGLAIYTGRLLLREKTEHPIALFTKFFARTRAAQPLIQQQNESASNKSAAVDEPVLRNEP